MNIQQIQASYDSTQDRILLRINTSEQTELRLWLTRRMVKGVWPALLQVAEKIAAASLLNQLSTTACASQHTLPRPDYSIKGLMGKVDKTSLSAPTVAPSLLQVPPQPVARLAPQAQGALADFARARALEKADFSTPFKETAHSLPLGELPLLPTQLDLTPEGAQVRIKFVGENKTIEMVWADEVLHALCTLLQQAVKHAQWEIELLTPSVLPAWGNDQVPPKHLLN